MKYVALYCLLSAAVMMAAGGCTNGARGRDCREGRDQGATLVEAATFNADSAFAYLKRQVAMGPRVSGTPANEQCRAYIVSELMRHGVDTVMVQTGEVTAYNGDVLPIGNVFARIEPELSDRVLLVAHYDTRPWADSDPDSGNHNQPVLGANDGASGVAVLLEVARVLRDARPAVGVDFLFVDAEDYGQSAGFDLHDETWCLGTQHWLTEMPYAPDALPRYGVLLDMVGGMGAKFHREYFSDRAASSVVDRVWCVAASSGYGDRFVNSRGGAVIDDHVFLNQAGIPTVNIIETKNEQTRSFAPTWHTVNDNIDHIEPASLKAAGQTVVNLLHSEVPDAD